jgi:heme/copper-type cytochrome/quinol oxidase subunit 2
MRITRRTLGFALVGAGLIAGPAVLRLLAHPPTGSGLAGNSGAQAQEPPPNRREFTITARDYAFSPDRIEVTQDDLVKLTVRSQDVAYSLTIDAYRVSRRVPAGGSTTLEFRADRAGTFPFYSNLTTDSRHSRMRGELVVRPR